MPTDFNPKHPNSEWYEELCALECIGELSGSEFKSLQEHLSECADCAQIHADFHRLSGLELGVLAVQGKSELVENDLGAPDGDLLLQRIIAQSKNRSVEPRVQRAVATTGKRLWSQFGFSTLYFLRRPAVQYVVGVFLLWAITALLAYHFRDNQLESTLANLRAQVETWRDRAKTSDSEKAASRETALQTEAAKKALEKSLQQYETRLAQLQLQRDTLSARISAISEDQSQKTEELAALRESTAEKDREISALQFKLQTTTMVAEEQKKIAEKVRKTLASADRLAKASPSEFENSDDLDSKSLFGARDLHIVDVYDVDSKGKTQRTYGRVYYVEKKLLIFYAFDLEDKRLNRAAAGFQAWGYSQANEAHPENLGLFTIDDASVDRWVLEVKNPRVLQRIDAVFVTLESPGGSPSPRGRRLLYANLAFPPNHP
jgi:hypothetical protein